MSRESGSPNFFLRSELTTSSAIATFARVSQRDEEAGMDRYYVQPSREAAAEHRAHAEWLRELLKGRRKAAKTIGGSR